MSVLSSCIRLRCRNSDMLKLTWIPLITARYTICLLAVLNNRELNRHLNTTHNVGEVSEFGIRNSTSNIIRLEQTDDRSGQAQVKVSVIVDTAMDYIELENMCTVASIYILLALFNKHSQNTNQHKIFG